MKIQPPKFSPLYQSHVEAERQYVEKHNAQSAADGAATPEPVAQRVADIEAAFRDIRNKNRSRNHPGGVGELPE